MKHRKQGIKILFRKPLWTSGSITANVAQLCNEAACGWQTAINKYKLEAGKQPPKCNNVSFIT